MPAQNQVVKELSVAQRQGYYRIGRAAKLTGVSAKMIRYYESLRLIPKPSRTTGDYRVYNSQDLHTLHFIKHARDLGFSLKETGHLLSLWRNHRRTSAEVKRLALKQIAELDQKIEQLESIRATLTNLTTHCHGDHRPECPILDNLSYNSNSRY